MRIAIASHIVLDSLQGSEGSVVYSPGGPPSYSGTTCRRFGFDVLLATKVGQDFPNEARQLFDYEKMPIQQRQIVNAPTTRFSIVSSDESRTMTLQAKCSQLVPADIENVRADCWLVSPVFDEIPSETLEAIKSNGGTKNFVMLDPQGYMRQADERGTISILERIDIDLNRIRAIKVDQQEMQALTGGLMGLDGMRALQSRGIEFVVSTHANEIHLLHKDTHYWAKLGKIDTPDSTGAGDIISAAFCCAYIKEKDPLWALCFGAGAVRAALETLQVGLKKIPSFSKIEENASYFYNTIGFKQLS
ncbi:MAG TPA: PfkB family carbohydrate kinase [Nitrososphaera sp.]|nr:PfkB family carbohydrate kinase [Nitrososphaera sp.]